MTDEEIDFSEHLYYDEDSPSGLRWRSDRCFGKYYQSAHPLAHEVAGCVSSTAGYWQVSLLNKLYRCHRIIWEMFYGAIPVGYHIDHINGNKEDNKLHNLRLVSRKGNMRNCKLSSRNKSGVKGVSLVSNGTGAMYWEARWTELDGEANHIRFSVKKLGNDAAFSKAVECRKQEMARLQESGAGYTDRHNNILETTN